VLVSLTRTVVDSLVVAIEAQGEWGAIQQALGPLILMAAIMAISLLLDSFSAWIVAGQSELVQDSISRLVQQQALRLNLRFFETAEYYDLLEQVRSDAARQPIELLRNLG